MVSCARNVTAFVFDVRDVEDAHTDAVRADAQPDVLARKLVAAEEAVESVREPRHVPDLASNDDAGLERLTCDLDQPRRAVVHYVRSSELRRADLQADHVELLRPTVVRALVGTRCLLRLLLRVLEEVAELDVLVQIHVQLSPARRSPLPPPNACEATGDIV